MELLQSLFSAAEHIDVWESHVKLGVMNASFF